jgi:hypothetical protein
VTSRKRLAATAATLAACSVLAACGGGDDGQGAGQATAPASSATTAPAAPSSTSAPAPAQTQTTATAPAQTTATAPAQTTATTSPEDQPGGAGDEEPARVPARFVLQADGSLQPATISVPAFLTIAVSVENRGDAAHQLEVAGAGVQVAAGQEATLTLEGRRAQRLDVLIDGAPKGVLVVGAEPGP